MPADASRIVFRQLPSSPQAIHELKNTVLLLTGGAADGAVGKGEKRDGRDGGTGKGKGKVGGEGLGGKKGEVVGGGRQDGLAGESLQQKKSQRPVEKPASGLPSEGSEAPVSPLTALKGRTEAFLLEKPSSATPMGAGGAVHGSVQGEEDLGDKGREGLDVVGGGAKDDDDDDDDDDVAAATAVQQEEHGVENLWVRQLAEKAEELKSQYHQLVGDWEKVGWLVLVHACFVYSTCKHDAGGFAVMDESCLNAPEP